MTVLHGDCLDILPTLEAASVDAIVCDPPYALEFMGKAWDRHDSPSAFQAWCEKWARECFRVMKPGAHMLAFGGSRTYHRLTCGIEDAGLEIRDCVQWINGAGFPKSLDVGKAIDRAAGAEREVTGQGPYAGRSPRADRGRQGLVFADDAYVRPVGQPLTAPATDAARQWHGWGTALKPAGETVVVAVKPQAGTGTLAAIGSHLDRLETECSPPASDAAQRSAPTRPASQEAKTGSAPAHAVTPRVGASARTTPTGAADASSEATAMSPCESTAATCLSIVTSWKRCLAALCELTSTSITATTSSTTTDLRTLLSCLLRITHASTLLDPTNPAGLSSLALAVDSLFAATVASLNATRALSVVERATAPMPISLPGGAAGYRTAAEPIVVARKPLAGTVAANVQAFGTGALNIDGCRVEGKWTMWGRKDGSLNPTGSGFGTWAQSVGGEAGASHRNPEHPSGRWPANVVLSHAATPDGGDGCEAGCVPGCPVAELDAQSGTRAFDRPHVRQTALNDGDVYGSGWPISPLHGYGDTGGASRFFPTFRYQAKAPTRERPKVDGIAHPTCKPLTLMQWLVRLVTPPGGTVCDPFAGSGTTAEACQLEGFRCIAIEREVDYLPLIRARLDRNPQTVLL